MSRHESVTALWTTYDYATAYGTVTGSIDTQADARADFDAALRRFALAVAEAADVHANAEYPATRQDLEEIVDRLLGESRTT